jgi:hypothetical protein
MIDKLVILFYSFGVLTTSFDTFLVINLGFTLRVSQFFFLIPILYSISTALIRRKVVKPYGYEKLLFWAAFVLAFIPNTSFIERNIAYGIWLIFNILIVFCTVQIFNTEKKLLSLFKWYLISFLLVALFGILQFLLPFVRISPPLVVQWVIPGIVARVNAFSYEPSYFATYMILGWASLTYFKNRDIRIKNIGKKFINIFSIILTIAIALSTSRVGWALLFFWYLQHPINLLINIWQGKLHIQSLKNTIYFIFVIAIILLFAIHFLDLSLLLGGTGLLDTSSHSSDIREKDFTDTLRVFINSPFIGHSLGGVASEVGNLRGVNVTTTELAKNNEGLNVFAEVLAASGIIGSIPFFIYIMQFFYFSIKLSRNHIKYNNQIKYIILGLTFAFFLELLALQFNQNILRIYVWVHIALLSACINVHTSKLRNKINLV